MARVPSVTLASILMRRAARSTVTGTEPAEGKFKVGAETLSSARASRRDGTAERDTSPRCKVEVTARDAARTLRGGANVFGGSGWTVAPTAISGAESCGRSSGTCGPTARCLWQVRSSLQRPRHRATGWAATTKTLLRLAGPEERVAPADTMRPPAHPPKDNDPRASSPGSA